MRTTMRLVHHFLEHSADLYPDKIAVIHEKNRTEYSLVNRRANQLAHSLLELGVGKGDRIAILCENSLEYIFCYYGILKAGCIAVPLNTDLRPDGLAELLRELEPRIFIVSSKCERVARSLELSQFGISRLIVMDPSPPPQNVRYRISSLSEELSHQPDDNPGLKIDPGLCAAIIYTSGSAGKPKGAMLSHANIVANTRAIVGYLQLAPSDVQMVVLPFFYVMGKSLLNTHFAVGGSVVINNKFAYTASVLKQIAEEEVTGFSGVPSTYAHLLFKSPLAKYRDKLPSLRYCSQAGGHMPRHVKLELLKILPRHTQLVVMYGATEASARLTYVPAGRLRSKIDSIGKPISGVTIDVLSPEGNVLEPGETGELVARGDNIMLGYYRDEEATKKALDRHGYHTGDRGYRDDEGFLYVTGRKDEQIKVGGHRINPREIEDTIAESGLAIESIVFTNPDSLIEDKLVGMAVPIREAADTVRNILAYCHKKLAKYKVPESLLLVDAIPKNSSGKLDRSKSLSLYRQKSGIGNT
jgi:long-chain acyl-CoA synthetase